jgi:hypothetical protein
MILEHRIMTFVIKTHDILSIQHNYAVVMLSVIMLNVMAPNKTSTSSILKIICPPLNKSLPSWQIHRHIKIIKFAIHRHLNIVRFAIHRHLDINSIAIHRHLNIIRFKDRLLPTHRYKNSNRL